MYHLSLRYGSRCCCLFPCRPPRPSACATDSRTASTCRILSPARHLSAAVLLRSRLADDLSAYFAWALRLIFVNRARDRHGYSHLSLAPFVPPPFLASLRSVVVASRRWFARVLLMATHSIYLRIFDCSYVVADFRPALLVPACSRWPPSRLIWRLLFSLQRYLRHTGRSAGAARSFHGLYSF